MSADRWPFEDPSNHVTFTTTQVFEQTEPILHVVHDEDGHWQFLGSTAGALENAKVIALHEAVDLDPSVLQLAELPVGWQAVRESVKGPWKREAIDDATRTV